MDGLYQTQRIKDLKDKMLSEPRYASIEQALIITKTYQEMKMIQESSREPNL